MNKYLFEKLDQRTVLECIEENIMDILLEHNKYENIEELISYIQKEEPRIEDCEINIHDNKLLFVGYFNNEKRVLELQK